MTREQLQDKTIGSLIGTFVGDAFALPVECQSPSSIRRLYGYLDKYVNNQFHPYRGVAKRPAGTKSDDSQLTLCMMDSLRRKCGYDLRDIRLTHIEAFEGKWGEPIGWGGSTREAIKKMKAGAIFTAIPEGAGNGPTIKIAPLAIYCLYKTLGTSAGRFTNSFNHALLKKCREVSMLTHGDTACIVASYCQARMIIRALQNELPTNSQEIADLIIDDAVYSEQKIQINPGLSARLKSILLMKLPYGDSPESSGCLSIFDLDTRRVSEMICQNKSSWIYNSYPLVAYCVAKYVPYKNFSYAITETASAGADADSNASMVGAIIGALLGFSSIPVHFLRGIRDWRILLQESKQFELSL